jgi:zinc transport system substrate-binding protein
MKLAYMVNISKISKCFITFLLLGLISSSITLPQNLNNKNCIKIRPISSNTNLNVVTTITIIQDIVENIVGHKVLTIVKGNADPHSYEPTPSEIEALTNADIIFRMGISGIEPWWRSEWDSKAFILVNNSMLEPDPLIDNELNPHVWMDPNNVKWFNNTKSYLDQLNNLLYNITTSQFGGTKVVINHPAFYYLFMLINVSRLAVIQKGEDKEPSAQDIANVINIMEEHNCHLIVTDPQHVTDNVYEIARETKSKIAILTPLLNVIVNWNNEKIEINSYIQMIDYDLWALANPIAPPSVFQSWLIFLIVAIVVFSLIGVLTYIRRR